MLHLLRSRLLPGIKRNDLHWIRYYNLDSGVFGFKPKTAEDNFEVPQDVIQARAANSNLWRLIEAYREFGHTQAKLDPLDLEKPTPQDELDPKNYHVDSKVDFSMAGLLHCQSSQMNLDQVCEFLRSVYCGASAYEFKYIQNSEEREWLAEKIEKTHQTQLSSDLKKQIAQEMLKSQNFDNYLATKFATVKRYGGEGAESMMAFFIQLFNSSAENGIEQVILAMPHRGRLNLLAGLLKLPPVELFQKMQGMREFPAEVQSTGDVLSHLTNSIDMDVSGKNLHVTMLPNPSHLEVVNPVAVGKTRARQLYLRDGDYSNSSDSRTGDKVLCVQIHGDAALAGQGVMMETLMFSSVPHFNVGGSIHLIVNNQIGFTTPPYIGRSSRYCSDLAKMIEVPVIHVNVDHPEELVKATKIAMDYRHKFRRDVFIDLVCYRRWGHNELDDPTFTNPQMYSVIHTRKSPPDLYVDKLKEEKILTTEDVNRCVSEHQAFLSESYSQIPSHKPLLQHLQRQWSGLVQAPAQITSWDTGVDSDLLKYIGAKSVYYPDGFTLHPHLHKTHVQARLSKITQGTNLDWSAAETLALGSLLYQGFNVRLSGQDVGRGTFSHRHIMLIDQNTSESFIPLNSMVKNQKGFIEVANSPLSEEAVLGFEYGFSIDHPNTLVIWEAQFGDFFNGAQIIIDTFTFSGETKWLRQSGLVMLLPHGYDGAGPEHSSCHLERFLQLCDSKEDAVDGDNVNVHIVNPTTSAQYFHLLRRQLTWNFRKPLVVVAPKILLRSPDAVSSLTDLAKGTTFKPVIGDSVNPESITRIIFCSGKHFYALNKHRSSIGANNTAIIRLEALCPFPVLQLQQELKKYSKAKEFIWSQEEHRNMGAWFFVKPRFENLVGLKLSYVGREVLGTPAVGIGQIHRQEAEDIIKKSF